MGVLKMNMETYTKNLKKVIESRHNVEDLLKRAIASIHYVEMTDDQHSETKKLIERSKEIIISGNIILKTVTDTEHIGEQYKEKLEEACEMFKEATDYVNRVLDLIESLK